MTAWNSEDNTERSQERTQYETDDGTEEWTGGQREQDPPPQESDTEDLPELEEEEDSTVRPENS